MAPSKLFHFSHFNSRNLKALMQERKLYFSNPQNFNDPYDALPSFDEVSLKQIKENVVKDAVLQGILTEPWNPSVPLPMAAQIHHRQRFALKVTNEKIDLWFEEYRHQVGQAVRMLCLCAQIETNLMWSHYAKGHTGFALQLDFRSSPWIELDQQHTVHPVKYDLEKRLQAPTDGNAGTPELTQRSPEWSYEKEWRVILAPRCLSEDGSGHYLELVEDSIDALHLGWQFKDTKDNLEIVRDFKRSFPRAKTFICLPDANSYKLRTNIPWNEEWQASRSLELKALMAKYDRH